MYGLDYRNLGWTVNYAENAWKWCVLTNFQVQIWPITDKIVIYPKKAQVITMEKRILAYRKRIDELLQREEADWAKVLEEHLTQIAFFQHERLVHLIVTVLFAVLEIMSILGTVILTAMDRGNIALNLMTILLLVLLIPYIRHYYILENEVQKMYVQYDELLKKTDKKE